MANTVRVSFHGAAGTVTGSKYLVEYEDKKILIDCGIFQGRKELRLRNWDKPSFNPKELDCIILTHAHIVIYSYIHYHSNIHMRPLANSHALTHAYLPTHARTQHICPHIQPHITLIHTGSHIHTHLVHTITQTHAT